MSQLAFGDAVGADAEASDHAQRLEAARNTIAAVASPLERPDPVLGAIRLRADQVETVRRVQAHLRRDGGCLLADDVGTGKTFVALAVARDWEQPLALVPASLRTTWERAARRADVPCVVATHESLSRGRPPRGAFDGIVVDESHRFRPTSRRHAVLADLSARRPLLMLSATPWQNRARELAGQLALFLGEAAFGLDDGALVRWIVRSHAPLDVALPRVAPARWLALDVDDEAVLRAILALPPPPHAADAGDGGVLLQLSLVRAWASSRAALVATIGRRRRTLAALEQCWQEGRVPTRRELRSWSAGDAVQLGFPTLLAATSLDRSHAQAIADAIERERAGLDALARTIELAPDADAARVGALRELRDAQAGRSLLAFSEWASTVRAYWQAMRAEPMVGMLTATDARIASGRVTRDEVLARFAPVAQGRHAPDRAGRLTLLLATDLLSEGMNLQDASVVVHLDLPWNPARLAQRLGRVRRPGGAAEVASHLMPPPASAAVLLRAEARLREKLARAERVIGRGLAVLPALTAPPEATAPSADGDRTPMSLAEARGEIARRLERWRGVESPGLGGDEARCVVAFARSGATGWIAALDDGRLAASLSVGAGVTTDDDVVLHALAHAGGASRPVVEHERERAIDALVRWSARDWSQRACGLDAVVPALRRRVLRALDESIGRTPRHRRAAALDLGSRVRSALARPLPLGMERALATLADSHAADWIERAAALVDLAPFRSAHRNGPSRPRALVVFGPAQ